jgi:organic hydroperoxide reductase OsmC/OhrA
MATYGCTIEWARGNAAFTDRKYSRRHVWLFDGGASVPASSSPHSVPVPGSDPAAVDPEEALVAAVSSCHMLWFLSLAAEQGFVVDSYRDAAEAVLGPVGYGRKGITDIVLHPQVRFSGATHPDQAAFDALHRVAHERCFIANSLRSAVRVEGRFELA